MEMFRRILFTLLIVGFLLSLVVAGYSAAHMGVGIGTLILRAIR